MACGILVPRPEIEPTPLALEARSLNHWSTRQVPFQQSLKGTPFFAVGSGTRVQAGGCLGAGVCIAPLGSLRKLRSVRGGCRSLPGRAVRGLRPLRDTTGSSHIVGEQTRLLQAGLSWAGSTRRTSLAGCAHPAASEAQRWMVSTSRRAQDKYTGWKERTSSSSRPNKRLFTPRPPVSGRRQPH